MIEFIILLVLVLTCIAYVVWPLLSGQSPESAGPGEGAAPPINAANRQEMEEALSDLEYDFRAGKLAPADYERLRASLRSRLEEPASSSPDSPDVSGIRM